MTSLFVFRSFGGMTLCLHDRLSVCLCVCVCVCVCLSVRQHFGMYTFISVYMYIVLIQQLIMFIFGMHVPYDQAYTVLMFLVTLPSLIMLIYAKSVSSSTFSYTLFYSLVYKKKKKKKKKKISLYLFKGEVQSRITIILKERVKISLQIGAKIMKIG